MSSVKIFVVIVSLVLGGFIEVGSIGKVHADTTAWATPFPDYCHSLVNCLNPGSNPWLGGVDTSSDKATSGLRVKIIISSDTNPANIPSGNSLGAGIAAAVLCAGSSDCGNGFPDLNSEDYIFYGFVDLSNSGRVRFISSGWHDCEFDKCAPVVSNLPKDCLTGENGWNTCPDSYHWQLFHDSWTCTDCSVAGSNFLVEMMWVGGTAVWNYYRSTSTCNLCLAHSFSYTPLSSLHMGATYKTGSGQTPTFPTWYHYQFGVTALNNIGAGWNIEMDDPEYYSTDCNSVISWCLVLNAAVYDGYNSYFDDNYVLGGRVFSGGTPVNEPNFNGVTVSSLQVDSKCYTAVGFSYTGNTPAQQNGQSLWTNAGPGCSFPGDVGLMTSSSGSVPADGTSTSTIMAQLANNAPKIQISFSSTLGQLSSSTCTTDSSGYCSITIKSSTVGTATVTATTCSIGNCPNAQTTVNFVTPAPPTFTISVSPTSQAIPVGSEKQTVVTVTSVNGFSGTVTLTAIPSSPVVACWFTTLTNTANVYVPAGGSAHEYPTCTSGGPAGNYNVYIEGASGTLYNCARLPVTVMDFGLAMSPPSISFASGSSTSGTLTITSLSGLAGTISLSSTIPSGLSVTCPSSVNLPSGGTATASCSFSSSSHGTYHPTITGTYMCNNCYYNGNDIHSLSITVTVTPEFSISSDTTNQSLIACDSCYGRNAGYFTITLTSLGGFSGNVNVVANSSPVISNCKGLQLDFVVSDYYACDYSQAVLSVPAGGTASSGLQVFVYSGSARGQYSITITATSGSLVHSIAVQVTVT